MTDATTSRAARQLTARAEALLEIGRPEQALEIVGEALGYDPNSFEAWCTATRCQIALKDAKAANLASAKAIEIRPGSSYALRLRSSALLISNMMNRAATEAAAKAVKIAPNDPWCHHTLASALRAGMHLVRARDAIDCAIALDPTNPSHLETAGLIELDTGQLGDAHRFFTDQLERDPNSWTAHNNLGVIAARRHRELAAIRHFDRSIRLQPKQTPIRNLHTTAIRGLRVGAYLFAFVVVLANDAAALRGVPFRLAVGGCEAAVAVGLVRWHMRSATPIRLAINRAVGPVLSTFGMAALVLVRIGRGLRGRSASAWRWFSTLAGSLTLAACVFGSVIGGEPEAKVEAVALIFVVPPAFSLLFARFNRSHLAFAPPRSRQTQPTEADGRRSS